MAVAVAALPPGFRFHPTDEELITYYLLNKVLHFDFTTRAIAVADLNKSEPWHLPGKAKMGEKEWYFFSLRDRKYPTGLRTNRATEAGYWKATGKDREIYSSKTCGLVGMKKTLVFYRGRAPKGEKTNWVMHEFRLDGSLAYHYLSRNSEEEWVISRVFQKTGAGATTSAAKKKPFDAGPEVMRSPCSVSLPPLLDPSTDCYDASSNEHVPCFSTAAPPNLSHNPLWELPPVPPPFSSASCFVKQSSSLTVFPTLSSLQENLAQLPSVSPPPPMQVGEGGVMEWAATESNELDCMWS